MSRFTSLARAKINLFLHVTGRRDDGYHLLDSLVGFADFGDKVTVSESRGLHLAIDGPFSSDLHVDDDNLVLQAAKALKSWAENAGYEADGASLVLEKNLPIASGIGGGSADAAAALRALTTLWRLTVPIPDMHEIAVGLGADVPVCLSSRSRIMRGVGDVLEEAPDLPPAWVVMANPMQSVSTPDVFKALRIRKAASPPHMPDHFATVRDFGNWLDASTRNDLEAPARRFATEIDAVLLALKTSIGVQIARMSGSGATCFGLFESEKEAKMAEATLRRRHSEWWVTAATLR
jgi:4-diphosphocytidyl-2-C-methyl-D-erythritol kinase